MIRALNITTDGVVPYEEVARSGQWLFLAPSVFNYYPATATLASGSVPAHRPHNVSPASSRANRLHLAQRDRVTPTGAGTPTGSSLVIAYLPG